MSFPAHTLESLLARSIPVPEVGCFLWEGKVHRSKWGYGRVEYKGKTRNVPRLIKELELRRPLLKTEIVRHSCDVPLCINPKHLLLGTYKDNTQDMLRRGRRGINRGTAIVIEQDVRAIHLAYAEGITRSVLAKQYAVHYNVIWYICCNHTWRDLL